MADRLSHRGPDDSGAWVDSDAGVALGFRRLAILDLSHEGHQPMSSTSGRYVMVFNGEVYNFCQLRPELEAKGHRFRGHSDTEVMLAAISEWGIEEAVKKFVGMFAIALWDRSERTLFLIRDRLGIKPLYYGLAGENFLFGSELKALRAHPNLVPEIDPGAVALFLRHNYIPQPYSIYKGIHKLTPGSILRVQADDLAIKGVPTPEVYWSARKVYEEGASSLFQGTQEEALGQLHSLLSQVVGIRMVADVPLGAFLSGGVDSSTVVALMQAQSNRAIKTFTIGFFEDTYNEARQAKKVAQHLGTDHTELYLTSGESMAVIPKLPTLYDEPFSDSSQIPTYLVSTLARQKVTVSLSGDGGDEVFGGYNRYFLGQSAWSMIEWIAPPLRKLLAHGLTRLSSAWGEALIRGFHLLGINNWPVSQPLDKIAKLAEVLPAQSPEEFYRFLVSHWKRPSEVIPDVEEHPTIFSDPTQWSKLLTLSEKMMFLDLVTYLPDDILTKVDRASMGVSLEARVPLLDHRLVEFCARLPLKMKIQANEGKRILRRILYRYVPKELIERPKMGFGIPLGSWLRGPLRDWAEDLLSEGRLKREGHFNPLPIRKMWGEHVTGGRNWQYLLWDVLMFQAWLAQWM